MEWIVVGNPEHRRVTGFLDALAQRGQKLRAVVAWQDLLSSPDALLSLSPEEAWVRLESLGENEAVQHALYVRGGGDPARRAAFGELLSPDLHHKGLLSVLDDLSQIFAARPRWRPLADTRAIARVFAKDAQHRDCLTRGVAVPQALAPERPDLQALLREMTRGEIGSVFVKQNTGSSAVGIAVLSNPARPRVFTTMLARGGRWFNTRLVQNLDHPRAVERVIRQLFEWGCHIEREIPKAMQEGDHFDLRVVTIEAEPAFFVVRRSGHVITNLHLGGQRGDLGAVRAQCPPEIWEAAMEDCRRVARGYDGLYLGIDLLFERGYTGHRVIEANAFGDLLPGLRDERGRTIYEAEIDASIARER